MSNEPLGEQYFNWLYRQVAPATLRNPARTYWGLLLQMYSKTFTWFVPNDDNRAADGVALRYEFLGELGVDERHHEEWLDNDCSVLEMMIALSRRLSFNGGGAAHEWFWHMVDNLGMRGFVDARPGAPEEIDYVLTRLVDRTYEVNGDGGLFPLLRPDADQRNVELWYQMNYYLNERG